MEMDQFVLFGDSLTQQSFAQTHTFAFGAALADTYARKLDVLNRGLNGYNTLQALRALSLCMPEPEHSRVRFLLIFFGANDARLAHSPGGPDQYVSVADFASNVRGMVEHPAVRAHEGVKIILVTTPPVDERRAHQADRDKYPALGANELRRTAANTALYAQAVRDLGVELQLPVLDIWTAMVSRAGYSRTSPPPVIGSREAPANETLQSFLHDGLHFTGEGYKILFGELMALIERTWPEEMPARLPMRLPPWDDPRTWHQEGQGRRMDGGGERGVDGDGGGGALRARGKFEAVIRDVKKVD
ncbi:hypothetical protein LTR08_006654 [Meristemomyces frigidus]|nr:hypothetical protein LTR08_006654 [Meristemomyces frigidus]